MKSRFDVFNRIINKVLTIIICTMIGISYFSLSVVFAEEYHEFGSKTYVFDKNSKYDLNDNAIEDNTKHYGDFIVSGDTQVGKWNGFSTYYVNNGTLSLYYKYDKNIDDSVEEDWHVCDDSVRSVNKIDLNSKLGYGTIIVQSSKDGDVWSTEHIETNAFKNVKNRNEPIYKTTDVQLNAGAYYRVIVAYKMEKYIDTTKILFFSHKNYEYKKYAEVYTFYASNKNTNSTTDSTTRKYRIGKKVLCEQFNGYAGEKDLKSSDLHYGWDLGNFFITGHTGDTKDNDNDLVILKNVGDEVTLWFNLEWDINSLNNDDNLRITADNSGSDQYFETQTMMFGKGALIVKKINPDNSEKEIQVYTNFLEANAKPGSNTVVQLFEEGDYEVALDYEVTKDTLKVFDKKVLDQTHHYRIYFKFSVRNSNCMVYPLDVNTNEKIINGSYAKDGFYLDLAKSKYLQINVKKSNLKDGTYDLVEDTEYNQLANEGTKFIEEGLYEITVTNRYTNISDIKRIYVGNNDLLKAYAVTGLSIAEIRKRIENGARVNSDGTLNDVTSRSGDITFAGLDDDDLLRYVEDNVYLQLIEEIRDDDLCIESITAKYVSKDYIENIEYNSRNNLFFGYNADELNDVFNGEKYIFTLGDNGLTTVKPLEAIDDNNTSEVLKNVLVGSGVILVCVVVSSASATAAPAISVIFAASATTGTSLGLYSGGLAAVTACIVRGYQTGDVDEAIKAAVLKGSEGFKWGAVSGAISGGAKEIYGIYTATENGLTMNQVATIQKEEGYPLDLISQLQNMEQVKMLKDAALTPEIVNGKTALIRQIDWGFKDELGRTNKERVLQNLSPIDPDGIPYELHHVAQEKNGTIAILTQSEHRSSATYSIWHKNEGVGVHSEISDVEWAKIRNEFWKALLKMKG